MGSREHGQNFMDETGKVYGKWTVLRENGRDKHKSVLWLVRCECRKESNVTGQDLRSKHTTQCKSCARKHPTGEANRNQRMREYERQARNRGLIWVLSKEEFNVLTSQNCVYCGAEPQEGYKNKEHNGCAKMNGIDRVDNSRGYEWNNCVPACKTCNGAKCRMTKTDFLSWIDRAHLSWNTTAASDGPHTLSATARDAAGNVTTASTTVSISNSSASASGTASTSAVDCGRSLAAGTAGDQAQEMKVAPFVACRSAQHE